MPVDDLTARRARRKADLLMASALAREQATLALDELQQRTQAVEERVQGWRDQIKRWTGAWSGLPSLGAAVLPARWKRIGLTLVLSLWGVSRLRRRRASGREPDAPATGSWALGPLVLVALPRLWRWGRRGRRAWQILRWWALRESASRQRARS